MKVLVIGDIIIDRYINGSASRLSPEAPVPVISHHNTHETLGGAALVYENLKSLNVDVELLDLSNVKCTKTRILSNNHYIARIDKDQKADGSNALDIILSKDFSAYNYVILSDYDKGVLEYSELIIKHINQFRCKVIVDPKKNHSAYRGAWLIKPNHKEYQQFNYKDWPGNIIVTGADGRVRVRLEGKSFEVSPKKVEVADVTGAGDCFLAAFVYGLTNCRDLNQSVLLAVKGGTESVKHAGTYILAPGDIEDRIIFTNGVFDILHKGHFSLLQGAKNLGSKLVVGINSDKSVKKIKGSERPINTQDIRKEQLEMLPWVDDVIIFDEDTPYELIKKLRPDLIVKGGDYSISTVVGNDLAPVHIVPTVQGYSTSKIIKNLK